MPGPKTSTEALKWIRDAVEHDRVIRVCHFYDQWEDREYDPEQDSKKLLDTATSCLSYKYAKNLAGGTEWTVVGTTTHGDRAQLGVEAYRNGVWGWVKFLTFKDD